MFNNVNTYADWIRRTTPAEVNYEEAYCSVRFSAEEVIKEFRPALRFNNIHYFPMPIYLPSSFDRDMYPLIVSVAEKVGRLN